MNKLIRIAVPTNDGLYVKQTCGKSRAFLVATVEEGSIINQEVRWNLLSEWMTSKSGYYYNIQDCDVMIIMLNGYACDEFMRSKNRSIFQTTETEITAALLEYLNLVPHLTEENLFNLNV
jgi:predicted Fe-Mo cluster-binding NifX family protein